MQSLSDHPVTRRWPPIDASRLQLYSFPTPNGVKVSIALEETGIAYDAHTVKISGDQHTDEFRALNPNGKIPAILDPDGPAGKPVALWESGAILLYLAEKTGQLLPDDPVARHETVQWLMFQMGGVGPMFGQYGFFAVFAGKDIDDPRPRERYETEARRLLGVLDARLENREYLMGDDYTIADIATFPWIRGAMKFYHAEEAFQMATRPNVMRWLEHCLARPAVQRGLEVPPRE